MCLNAVLSGYQRLYRGFIAWNARAFGRRDGPELNALLLFSALAVGHVVVLALIASKILGLEVGIVRPKMTGIALAVVSLGVHYAGLWRTTHEESSASRPSGSVSPAWAVWLYILVSASLPIALVVLLGPIG